MKRLSFFVIALALAAGSGLQSQIAATHALPPAASVPKPAHVNEQEPTKPDTKPLCFPWAPYDPRCE